MINAVRAAADFSPGCRATDSRPRRPQSREGFLHPYQIERRRGRSEAARSSCAISRRPNLADLAGCSHEAAATVTGSFPRRSVEVQIKTQYRNMAEGLRREPRAVAYAQRALERLGREAKLTIVRGGTDGSRLTEMGLPTPNLSCGAYASHSPLEWACLDEMVQSVQWLVALAETWAEEPAA